MNPVSYPKLTRARWYLQVDKEGKSVSEICRIFGIARKTYYKWYATDHGYRRSVRRPAAVQPGDEADTGDSSAH